MHAGRFLCVVGDDFGMHPAINKGIVEAFTKGLLTDTNLMAPCPAFAEAVELCRQHQIPAGLHATFTCEWDIYSWGPLTNAASFMNSRQGFKETMEDAWGSADDEEGYRELVAQYDAMVEKGIRPTHLEQHMPIDKKGKVVRAMQKLSREKKIPFKTNYPSPFQWAFGFQWTSVFLTSDSGNNYQERKAWLWDTLKNLGAGYHLWISHPALDSPSLDLLCSQDSPAFPWARLFRQLDLALLLDPEIKDYIADENIQCLPMEDVPTGSLEKIT